MAGKQRRGPAAGIHTVADARELARRRLPGVIFDYIDGAAEAERTAAANVDAFGEVGFLPQMALPGRPASPRLATTVMGEEVRLPVLLAPVGFTRAMHPGGDVATARVAKAAGTRMCLSSMSGHTMEQVIAAAEGPAWFQLYGLGGREGAKRLARHARELGYTVMLVTVDTPLPGNRERDLRHGVTLPLRVTRHNAPRLAPQGLSHPGWLYGFVRDGFTTDLALVEAASAPGEPMSQDEAIIKWVLEPVTWDDLPGLADAFGGPVLAKGVLSARDARRALDAGAAGIVVSNHGGRQLDTVPSALRALVEVVDEVGGEVEVLMDGGIRRGSDVAKALSLGARAVLVGRPWAYGLAAAGEPGAAKVLELLRADLDRTLRLLGVDDVADLSREHVSVPASWSAKG